MDAGIGKVVGVPCFELFININRIEVDDHDLVAKKDAPILGRWHVFVGLVRPLTEPLCGNRLGAMRVKGTLLNPVALHDGRGGVRHPQPIGKLVNDDRVPSIVLAFIRAIFFLALLL